MDLTSLGNLNSLLDDLHAAQAEALAIELYQDALDVEYWEELDRQMEAVALGLEQEARAKGEQFEWQVQGEAAYEQVARKYFGDLFDKLGMRVETGSSTAVRFQWAGHPWELAIEEYASWRLTRLDPSGRSDQPFRYIPAWDSVRRLWVALYHLQYLPVRKADPSA